MKGSQYTINRNQTFSPFIQIIAEDEEIGKYGIHPNIKTMERHLWGIKYHGVKKNGFFLEPKKEKKMTVRSHLSFDARGYVSDITSFSSRDLEEVTHSQLILYIDSSQIKRDLLLPKDIDSLYQNNIKIFHGTIYSNKVPLKLK